MSDYSLEEALNAADNTIEESFVIESDFMDNSINQDDVQNNPEKYLNYTQQTETIDTDSTDNNDRISVLEENQQIIIEALAEIIGG